MRREVRKEEHYIIQKSKNSTKKTLPELSDIQDGLFKLILYSNIDSLQLNGLRVLFATRLKLTGKNIRDRIILPCSLKEIESFLKKLDCTQQQRTEYSQKVASRNTAKQHH